MVAQEILQSTIFLSRFPMGKDYRCVPPCLTLELVFKTVSPLGMSAPGNDTTKHSVPLVATRIPDVSFLPYSGSSVMPAMGVCPNSCSSSLLAHGSGLALVKNQDETLKDKHPGAGGTAQWLGTLTAPMEGIASIPSTHTTAHKHVPNS